MPQSATKSGGGGGELIYSLIEPSLWAIICQARRTHNSWDDLILFLFFFYFFLGGVSAGSEPERLVNCSAGRGPAALLVPQPPPAEARPPERPGAGGEPRPHPFS